MFKKILIANRGEIACRVMATASRMGIKTVAVYSDADAKARHVRMADEAVHIGGTASSESYLVGTKIIDAALKTGAEAIHPGYGFLSENPDFVDAVEAAGLVFIGPRADTIRAMGLKDAAKDLMADAGVPVVPGYQGTAQDVETLAKEAEAIGYPVLIKARAGGGGKGMRLVERPEDFAENLAAAQREGAASFGDPHCLIEKFIQNPRHIEVQVFGDAHGNVVHLNERDCTLQRRHQKVIEEAPAPGMTDEVRAAMCGAAVKAAEAIGYQGAGTIEFIVDGTDGLRPDGFWFMEMNTRLQVEHPVTEAITGFDLVEWQIRVANGDALPVRQDEIGIHGHAIELRLNAEDATKGFLPAIGKLGHLQVEAAGFERAARRFDSAVEAGDEVSQFYDPMIGKLIVHEANRDTAIAAANALAQSIEIAPNVTNIAFLDRLLAHPVFVDGTMDTGLIERDFDALVAATEPSSEAVAIAALISLNLVEPPTKLANWRGFGQAEWFTDLVVEGESHTVKVVNESTQMGDGYRVEELVIIPRGDNVFEVNGLKLDAPFWASGDAFFMWFKGQRIGFALRDHGASDDANTGDTILAPMPGLVRKLYVGAGEKVEKGAAIVMLEAMKMEHVLRAPRDGVIAEILASEGAQVIDGTVLARLETDDE